MVFENTFFITGKEKHFLPYLPLKNTDAYRLKTVRKLSSLATNQKLKLTEANMNRITVRIKGEKIIHT